MAKIQITSAFVEDAKGSPVFVLKIAEPHSRKDEQGNWQTVARTFFDVKVSKDSGIDLGQFGKGDRIQVWGSQKTEVREHEGKKYYTLVVWADRIEVAQRSQGGHSGQGGGFAEGNSSDAANGAQGGVQDQWATPGSDYASTPAPF